MRDLTDDETLTAKAVAKRQVDFDDLQNEVAGNATGRMVRFLNADDDRSPEGKRRKRERQAALDRRLVDLLKDPEYAVFYGELGQKLGEAERAADAALARVQAQLHEMDQILADMEARAARRLDGRMVLRMDDGRVLYADGSAVRPDIAEGIIWPDNAPSGDAYFAMAQARAQLADHRTDWHTYRNDVLGSMRDKYEDDANPYQSVDDMKEALDAIDRNRPLAQSFEFKDKDEALTPSIIPTAFPTLDS